MSRARRFRSGAGFTLVELLVGLALTAMAATLLMQVIGAGRSAAQRADTRANAAESVAATQALLRGRIELLSAETESGDTTSHGAAQGDATRFGFLAPALGSQAANGLVRYNVALGRQGVLELATADARAGTSSLTRWRVMALIGDVSAIEWSFYGAGQGGGEPRWQATWLGHDDPPQLVRLRLRFVSGDLRTWPDLVVRAAASVSTACDLDPGTGACRAS